MTTNTITFTIRPRFCKKFNFSIGIETPNFQGSISSSEYVQIVENSIKNWETSLQTFSSTDTKHNHLAKFDFNIHEQIIDSDDIQIRWWPSNTLNGRMIPDNRIGEVTQGYIFISQQKLVNENLGQEQVRFPKEVHTKEQIESIIMHEFGHVLNIGDCTDSRDLMSHGGPITPNTNRKLSNLDLEMVSMTFQKNYVPGTSDSFHNREYSEWKAI